MSYVVIVTEFVWILATARKVEGWGPECHNRNLDFDISRFTLRIAFTLVLIGLIMFCPLGWALKAVF